MAVTKHGFCQVMDDGRIRCRKIRAHSATVHDPPPEEGDYEAIALHATGFCALARSGDIDCWRGIRTSFDTEVQFDGTYTDIGGNGTMICAIDTDGNMECAKPKTYSPTERAKLDEPLAVDPVVMPGGPYRALSDDGRCALSEHGADCFIDLVARDESEDALHHIGTEYGDMVATDGWRRIRGEYVQVTRRPGKICVLERNGKALCYDESGFHVHPFDTDDLHSRYRYDRLLDRGGLCGQRNTGEVDCESAVDRQVLTFFDEPPAASAVVHHRNFGESPRTALVAVSGQGEWRSILDVDTPRPKQHRRDDFVDLYPAFRNVVCGIRDDETVYCEGHFFYDDDLMDSPETLYGGTTHFVTAEGRWGRVHGSRKHLREPIDIYGRDDDRNDDYTDYTDVQHGNDFGCGLAENGRVDCWGTIMGSAKRATPPSVRMEAIGLGGVFACGIGAADGAIHCWGNDYYQHLENAPADGRFAKLKTSYLNICALRDDDHVVCWGRAFGDTYETPFSVDEFTIGNPGVCAVRSDNEQVECAGLGIVWN